MEYECIERRSIEALVISLQQICALLRNGVGRCHYIARDMTREDRRIDDPQAINSFHSQLLVDHLAH